MVAGSATYHQYETVLSVCLFSQQILVFLFFPKTTHSNFFKATVFSLEQRKAGNTHIKAAS